MSNVCGIAGRTTAKTKLLRAAVTGGFAGRGTGRALPRDPHSPSVMGTVPFRGALSRGGDDGRGAVSDSSPDLDPPHS